MDFLAQITAQLQASNARQELNDLCKDRTVNVRLKVDDSELQNALTGTFNARTTAKTGMTIGNQIGTSLTSGIQNTVKKNITVASLLSSHQIKKTYDVVNKQGQASMAKAHKDIENLFAGTGTKAYTSKIFDKKGNLTSFTTMLKHVSGEVESVTYSLNDLGKAFEFQGATSNDSGIEKRIKAIDKAYTNYSDKLSKLKNDSNYNVLKYASPELADFENTLNDLKTGSATIDDVKTKWTDLNNKTNTANQKQQKYYSNLGKETENLYNLKTKLLTADEAETKELKRQIKNAQTRIKYNEDQLDKNNLRDNSLGLKQKDIERQAEDRYKIAEQQHQDRINAQAESKRQQELERSAKEGQKQRKQDLKNEAKYQQDLNKEREKGRKQADKIASDRAKEEQKVDERWQKAMWQQDRHQREEQEAEEYSKVLMDAYDEADQNVAREKAEREAVERERKIGQEQAKEIARQHQEEQQLIDQMENMRLQSEESARRREQQMNDSQVSAMNKAQEQDYKERQKQEEKQMKESVDAINRSNKEKEKAYQQEQKTRKDNADYLIKEAFSTYDKIAQAESNALKSNASGNTELEKYYNDQVSAHRLYMTQLKTELKQYSDIYDDDSINNILGNKEKESKSVVEKTVAQLLDKDNADITKASAELDRKLASYTSDFTDGSLSSSLKQMNNAFNEIKRFKLDDKDNVQVKSIEEADKALSDFRKSYIDLQNHFNGSKILDDATLLSTFEKLEISSAKFKNSMSEVKIDVQPFLQIEKALENASTKLKTQDYNLQNVETDASQLDKNKYGNTKQYQLMISYIDQAKAKQSSLNQEISKGADADFNKINLELREMNSLVSKAKTQYDKLEQPISEIEAQTASNKTLSWLKENSKAAKEFGDRLQEISNQQSLSKTAGELENLNKEFAKIKSEAQQKGLTGLSGFDEISRATKRIAEFTGIYAILENVITDIPKQMVDAVIKVDDAMTSLRMATSVTSNEAKELMKTYSELGKELKTLGTDVSSSATEWLKQGKSISEASALAKDSIVLSKISGMSSEDSTKTITAAMKSYELSASEVMGFIDQISSIDMASATDVQGLSNAFNEVAANARQAGVETEKLLSYAAVIGETTQEGMAGVGTALNAIFSRMGNIKLSRLKDFETGEDLSNVETVLRKVGISLRDGEGQFRQFDEVLDETASKFNSFSSVTQRAVANAFAGTHHANSFMVLMQNYPKVQEYVTIAMNSSGESMKKFEAYTDSATGKIEGFKNAFQTLSNTVINSDLFKGVVDSGTALLNVLENIIETLGLLPVVLTGTGLFKFVKNFDWHSRKCFILPYFKLVNHS